MTLILDLDLDILQIYMFTKHEACSSRHSKIKSWERTDRHRDATEFITTLHLQVLIMQTSDIITLDH